VGEYGEEGQGKRGWGEGAKVPASGDAEERGGRGEGGRAAGGAGITEVPAERRGTRLVFWRVTM